MVTLTMMYLALSPTTNRFLNNNRLTSLAKAVFQMAFKLTAL
jgi:hypothetical protein